MSVKIELKPELKISTRLQVLYYVVFEIAESLGAEKKALETIRKGVLERQLLSFITINYLTRKEKLAGKVVMSIDWNKHRVLAKNERGRIFELDSSQSVRDQISELYSILVDHTRKLRKVFPIEQVVVQYGYTREVWADEKKLKEAREYLGLSAGTEFEWADIGGISPDITFEIMAKELEELKINVEHHKPRKED